MFPATAAGVLVGIAKAVTSEVTSSFCFPTIDSQSIHLSSQEAPSPRKENGALGIDWKARLVMFIKIVEGSHGTILNFILRRDEQQKARARYQTANNCIKVICQRLAYLGRNP